MPESSASATLDVGTASSGNQLAALIPTFDPAVDNVEQWSQKIELLTQVWPESRLSELATRIILNCRGSAFATLQLKQKELLGGTIDCISQIVSIVGGQFGQVSLEQKFDIAEKAIFRCSQKADESADSYIARPEVVWTELLMKKINLAEVQVYIILRGSKLTMDDKKRVLVESGAERAGGELEMKNVAAAIRMLGSSFFQEYTSGKREKGQKTYDHLAFGVDEVEDYVDETGWEPEESMEDDLEALAVEDDDASMVLQFENAVMDTIQEDKDLATFYVSYQDARKRLLDKSRSRGFWPSRNFKGGKKGKGKGVKGKSKSLAHRIANSTCRLCGQAGHWKAECPSRKSTTGSEANQVPTSFVVELNSCLQDIPEVIPDTPTCSEQECFAMFDEQCIRFRDKLREKLRQHPSLRNLMNATPRDTKVKEPAEVFEPVSEWSAQETITCFASSGSVGVVDLGASQTVIGSKQVPELLHELPSNIRSQVRKTSCNLVFRFGNHQTLTSRIALILPVHNTWFRIAIVPGQTPFLLSNEFLRTIQAVIDAEASTLWSKKLGKYLETTKSPSNLMMLDLNQLWPQDILAVQDKVQVQESFETQPRTERPVPKDQPADESSSVDTEQCFESHHCFQSMLIKTNPIEVECQPPVNVEAESPLCADIRESHVKSIRKLSSSQAVKFDIPSASQRDVQSSTEARPVPGRSQEGTDAGRPAGHRTADVERSQDHANSLRQGKAWDDLRRSIPG